MGELQKGDYVLATKWSGGDPGDGWAVGFYDGILPKEAGPRCMVVDEGGKQFRQNGFRRVKKISKERGEFILRNKEFIACNNTKSLWYWARCKMF